MFFVLSAAAAAGDEGPAPEPAPDLAGVYAPPDLPPVEKHRARPAYPRTREQGVCVVRAQVAPSGVVVAVEIVECPEVFRASATEAAMASSFYPYAATAEGSLPFEYVYRFQTPSPMPAPVSPVAAGSPEEPPDADPPPDRKPRQ